MDPVKAAEDLIYRKVAECGFPTPSTGKDKLIHQGVQAIIYMKETYSQVSYAYNRGIYDLVYTLLLDDYGVIDPWMEMKEAHDKLCQCLIFGPKKEN